MKSVSTPPPDKGHRVLIADNDRNVSSVLTQVLEKRGLEVESVPDGEAAVARLHIGGIACLVLDLDMPRLGGEELLQRVAGWSGAPHVVVISGFIDAALESSLARSPHVRAVLRKPFDVLRFAALVEQIVSDPGASCSPPPARQRAAPESLDAPEQRS